MKFVVHSTETAAVRRLRITTPIYNPSGGPVRQAHLFVAALDVCRRGAAHDGGPVRR